MRRALAVPVALLALLTAGCAPTVTMTAAPQASSARCAGVVVRLPERIDGQGKRATDAQGTAAWGDPVRVTLTCGVPVLAATTTTCTTVAGIDWLLETRTIADVERRVLTTYGRVPAVELVVDAQDVAPDAVLEAVAEPIATATRANGQRCLAPSETAP